MEEGGLTSTKTQESNDGSFKEAQNVPTAVVELGKQTNSQVPREDMVATAIRFLENPKVAPSSNEVKRAFLTKKGLTAEEIELAFQRARPVSLAQQPSQVQHPNVMTVAPYPSGWQRFRDLANIIVLIGGSIYGLKFLWEKYVRDWLYGKSNSKQKSVMEITLELHENVQKSVEILTGVVEKLQNSLDAQSASIKQLLEVGLNGKADKFSELQRDIQSVKGLLLNSNRFPSNPPIQPHISIPAWQLTSSSQSTKAEEKSGHENEETKTGDDSLTVRNGTQRKPDVINGEPMSKDETGTLDIKIKSIVEEKTSLPSPISGSG